MRELLCILIKIVGIKQILPYNILETYKIIVNKII